MEKHTAGGVRGGGGCSSVGKNEEGEKQRRAPHDLKMSSVNTCATRCCTCTCCCTCRVRGRKCCDNCGEEQRLTAMIIVTLSYAIIEVSVGIVTNAMTLTSDAFHMISDVIAQIVALYCLKISSRSSKKHTYGWKRTEVLGALINSAFLLALCVRLAIRALHRLVDVEPIKEIPLLLVVGGAGLALNVFGLVLLGAHGHSHGGDGGHGHSKVHSHVATDDKLSRQTHRSRHSEPPVAERGRVVLYSVSSTSGADNCPEEGTSVSRTSSVIIMSENLNTKKKSSLKKKTQLTKRHSHHHEKSMNLRGVILHLIGDLFGSVIVIVSGIIIWQWGNEGWTLYVDPALTLCSVLIIICTTLPLLKESSLVLLQTVPGHIFVDRIGERLLEEVDGIVGIHDFHVWCLSGRKIIASLHVNFRNFDDYEGVAEQVKEFLHNQGIHSTSIQPEFGMPGPIGDACNVPCQQTCAPLQCCSTEDLQLTSRRPSR